MSVVIFFASKLAGEYGFSQVNLVVFVAVITVSGHHRHDPADAVSGPHGPPPLDAALPLVWIATSVAFALYAYLAEAHGRIPGAAPYPTWPLWIIGNLLGFGLGSLGASNRAFVGFLAPPSRAGEVFGLWGLMFKLAAIMTFPFAWIKDTIGTPAALLLLAGFLIVGAATHALRR